MVDYFNENIIWKIYVKGKFFAKYFTAFLIVSVTRIRRDTEMLCLLATLWISLIVSNDHGHMQKCNFLEFQFWANLVQKFKIVQFNLKFGTKPKPNKCDSIYVNFFCFGLEIPFLEKFGLKIQNCLKWSLIHRWCSPFLFLSDPKKWNWQFKMKFGT